MPSPLPDLSSRACATPANPRQRQPQALLVWLGAGAATMFVLVLLAVAGGGQEQPARPRTNGPKSSKRAARKPQPVERMARSDLSPLPTGPRTLADLMAAPDDAKPEAVTVTSHLSAARAAMAARDIAAARRAVEAAGRLAQSPTEKKDCQRTQTLVNSLDAFWKAVAGECGRLRSGQEIELAGRRAMVVESRADLLTVREAGKIRLYPRDDLPPDLAVTLAQRGLKNSDPNVDLHVGSFHAVDAQGDRQAARRHWQRAGEPGRSLMGELELPVSTPAVEPSL